jgi:hypothetical protein
LCAEISTSGTWIWIFHTTASASIWSIARFSVSARDPETEVLYDEVDVWDAGVFVHRLLFWPHYPETDIVFEGLSITRTSRLDRRVEARSDRYAET